MTALLLDTLRLSRALQKKGNYASEQPEALAEALGGASRRRSCDENRFGGGTDRNRRIETELKTELAGVGTEIAELRTELRSGVPGARGELRSEITSVGTEFAEFENRSKDEIDSVIA